MSFPKTKPSKITLDVKFPELIITWKKENGGLVSNEIPLDLGILGKFTLGPIKMLLDEPPTPEEKKEAEQEVHIAFMRLLCKFAALAVVKLDQNPNVLLNWYSHMKDIVKGDPTIHHAISDQTLHEITKQK